MTAWVSVSFTKWLDTVAESMLFVTVTSSRKETVSSRAMAVFLNPSTATKWKHNIFTLFISFFISSQHFCCKDMKMVINVWH